MIGVYINKSSNSLRNVCQKVKFRRQCHKSSRYQARAIWYCTSTGAGGQPSTWLPPGGLVEHILAFKYDFLLIFRFFWKCQISHFFCNVPSPVMASLPMLSTYLDLFLYGNFFFKYIRCGKIPYGDLVNFLFGKFQETIPRQSKRHVPKNLPTSSDWSRITLEWNGR